MDRKKELYEPVLDFRKNKPQIQIETATHCDLYEKAFCSREETSHSEYSLNTATWD